MAHVDEDFRMVDQPDQGTPDECVQRAVTAMLADRSALADDIASYLIGRITEIRDLHVEDLVRASCRANMTAILDNLARQVPSSAIAVSTEVLDYTHAMVRRELSLDAVMSGYRMGAVYFVQRWIDTVAVIPLDQGRSIAAIKIGSAYIWDMIEVVCQQLTLEYRAEAARLRSKRSRARLEGVRAVLAGSTEEPGVLSRRLGYPIQASHVAMVVYAVSDEPGERIALDAAWRELTRGVSASRLAVHADTRILWCWLARRAETSFEPVLSQHGVVVGVGRTGVGPEGFRRSHREAVAALRVAQIASGHVPAVLHYDDVSVAALCTADEAFARRFVHDELGPLLGADHTSRMQRETLAAFYAANSNYRATAAALGVHHNTVRYRLEQIEHRLGRPVSDRRLALEVAVHLAGAIGSRTPTRIATRE
jgi:hypothetical protein